MFWVTKELFVRNVGMSADQAVLTSFVAKQFHSRGTRCRGPVCTAAEARITVVVRGLGKSRCAEWVVGGAALPIR